MITRQALTEDGPPVRPIIIGGFALHATGVTVRGRPSLAHYQAAWAVASRAHQASGFWLADLLRYGDTRAEWAEHLSQVQHVTGLSEKRLANIRAVGAIDPSRRRDSVEFAIHEEVAGLAGPDQEYWLDKVETEGWTRNELRLHRRAAKRRTVIEGQAVLEGQYRVIMADPPWRSRDSGVITGSAYARAESSDDTMSMEDLCKLPVAAHTLPNATLFLWVPAPLLLEAPGPREVLESWGFSYRSNRVWDKVHGMPSNYAQQITHEHLIIAVRGDGKPDEPTPHEPSIFRERVGGEHAEKPNHYLRTWIEKHWTIGPRLELFGRAPVDGWTVWGADARLWPIDTESLHGVGAR